MWRRWWVYGSPTLKQSFNAVVAHGFFQGRNFNFNTGISPKCCSLLDLRAMLTICYGETRILCFPAFLPVGSKRALSSDSPSSSFSSPSSSSQSSTKSGKSNSCSNGDQRRGKRVTGEEDIISFEEAKKLMRLVNVESLKVKLGIKGKEVISYTELLEACENIGVARSREEAIAFVRVLDEAGVLLLFRDKVYLHPDKVVALVRRAVPLALTPENDPIREELKTLLGKKEEIDMLAHKQVRRILWVGLGLSLLQLMLFLRLTFWEFSWDVMEPIAFFTTSTGIVISYAYFLFTSRDPTYVDLMKRLFLNRQRKLLKRYNFDVQRMKELQRKCITPLDAASLIKKRTGFELELDDALHKDH